MSTEVGCMQNSNVQESTETEYREVEVDVTM